MNREDLVRKFPKIMARMDEDTDDLRYLLVIDENYDDPEVNDEDVFDPADYNYMVYLTEDLREIMGEELLERLPELIESEKLFESYLASEEDLYGVWFDGSDEDLGSKILSLIEREIG